MQVGEPLVDILTPEVFDSDARDISSATSELESPRLGSVPVGIDPIGTGDTLGGVASFSAVEPKKPFDADQLEACVDLASMPVIPTSLDAAPNSKEGFTASPAVRKLAQDHLVCLAVVKGTGSEGLITEEDLLQYIQVKCSAEMWLEILQKIKISGDFSPLYRYK